jgi:tetrapyrrole methylase family protein/MazG family protein
MAKALDQLKSVVARLRSPKGCPWDRKQTHRSLIPFLREESEELAVALKRGRWGEMEDELGDILFHVMLHAKIAEENGQFTLEDVARSQAVKLMRRHPHVFARDRKFDTAEEVLRHWKEIKNEERVLRARDVAARSRAAAKKRRARA